MSEEMLRRAHEFAIRSDQFRETLRYMLKNRNIEFCSASIGRSIDGLFWNIVVRRHENESISLRVMVTEGCESTSDETVDEVVLCVEQYLQKIEKQK